VARRNNHITEVWKKVKEGWGRKQENREHKSGSKCSIAERLSQLFLLHVSAVNTAADVSEKKKTVHSSYAKRSYILVKQDK
jgi:hypothetical protein